MPTCITHAVVRHNFIATLEARFDSTADGRWARVRCRGGSRYRHHWRRWWSRQRRGRCWSRRCGGRRSGGCFRVRRWCRRGCRRVWGAGSWWGSWSRGRRCGRVCSVDVTQADPLPKHLVAVHLGTTVGIVNTLKGAMLASTYRVCNITRWSCVYSIRQVAGAKIVRLGIALGAGGK
jgi:hypothetical protein